MADEDVQLPEGSEEGPKKKPIRLLAVLAVCAIAGGGAGVFVVAPMLLGPSSAEAADAGDGGHAPAPRRSGGHGRSSGPLLYSVENLVLNPAESNGTRFLMVSAAFEVSGDAILEEMRGRDAEIRDILNRTLGQRTVPELTDLSRREALREAIRLALNEVLHGDAILKVYLPQFVIQ